MRPICVFCSLFLIAGPSAIADDPKAGDRPYGLEKRLSWDDSGIIGSPDPTPPYKVARAFPGITVKQPLTMTPEPGTDRLFLLQHLAFWSGPGRLLAIRDDQGATELEVLLEIDGIAYGLAFHPDYPRNGQIFLGLNGPVHGKKTTQVVRYTRDPRDPRRVDPASKRLIIEWSSDGHNGGDLAFGDDGSLYVSAGDGTSGSDANLTGQTLDDLQASVLRIDVDHPDPGREYGVPKDNPFVGRPGARPELWAYGLRNPWRLTFDGPSKQLWAGNNGQDLWEQVYLIQKGANYGWSIAEGSHPFHPLRQVGPDPISPPTTEHHHSEARSLTGGHVYRGTRLPELVGAYVYGDWSTGRVWGVKHDGSKILWHRELVDTPFNITGFGTDHAGELYVIDQAGGFYRFEPTTEADRPSRPFPTRLSQTGLFASLAPFRPHPATIGYDVVAPQWSDGATMERTAGLAGLERIEQKSQPNAGGDWTLPNGSVLTQTLSLELVDDAGRPSRKRIETRFMARLQGEWIGYSYRWNPEQTDAELVSASGDSEAFDVADPSSPGGRREQIWRFPARTECLVCHSRAVGFVLGFTPLQLDRDRDYGGKVDNQLRTLEHIGAFRGALPARQADRPRLVDPDDIAAPLEARARSYLAVNCSSCHVQEGGGNARMELGMNTPLARARLIDVVPDHAQFDIPDARLVAPGSPERSVLYHRISRRGGEQMPPLVSSEVDRKAVAMIADWIRSLSKAGH